MTGRIKLSPTSVSRRVLTLEFIRRYFVENGAAPSFGEIGAALGGIPIQRVSSIIRELELAGELVRTPGKHRGLKLPEEMDERSTSEALLILQRRGWIINGATFRLEQPLVINPQLTVPDDLDDIP